MAVWKDATEVIPGWEDYFPEEYKSPYPDDLEEGFLVTRTCLHRNCNNEFTAPADRKFYCHSDCQISEYKLKKKDERRRNK